MLRHGSIDLGCLVPFPSQNRELHCIFVNRGTVIAYSERNEFLELPILAHSRLTIAPCRKFQSHSRRMIRTRRGVSGACEFDQRRT